MTDLLQTRTASRRLRPFFGILRVTTMAKSPKGGDAKLPVYGSLTYDSGVAEIMKPVSCTGDTAAPHRPHPVLAGYPA